MRLQISFPPLLANTSFNISGGQLTQEFDIDSGIYIPDRTILPVVIQPIVNVTDPANLFVSGIANNKLVDVKWYKDSITPANEIKNTESEYVIDRTSATNDRGKITVYKNVLHSAPLTLIFVATFIDSFEGSTRRKIDLIKDIVLSTTAVALPSPVLEVSYPRGNVFNPFKRLNNLILKAELKEKSSLPESFYWWYRLNGTTETPLSSTYDGYNTNEVKIPTSEIGSLKTYVVKSIKASSLGSSASPGRQDFIDLHLPKIGENLIKDSLFRKGFKPHSSNAEWGDFGELLNPSFWQGVQFGSFLNVSYPTTNNAFAFTYNINIISGQTYTITYRIKTTGIEGGGIGVSVNSTTLDGTQNALTGTNDWQVVSITFEALATKSSTLYIGGLEITAGTFEIEYVVINEGADSKGFGFNNIDELLAEAQIRFPAVRPVTAPSNAIVKGMSLGTTYPKYRAVIKTPFGEGDFVTIPPTVASFQVQVEIETAYGILPNPHLYFDVDWGGGITGFTRTITTASIGLGTMNLNPTITEKF